MKCFSYLVSIPALLISLSITMPAIADNGVIEINQASVAIGGVSNNDTPGFPVNIYAPGHYRLTSNLVIHEPEWTSSIIEISADNVTVDLNGFSVIGPVECQPDGRTVTCTDITNSFAGIRVWSKAVTIMNGTVTGFSSGIDCASAATGCVVKNVTAYSNHHSGISLSPKSRASNCISYLNGSFGILAGALSFVENSILSLNGSAGLRVTGDGVTAISNVFNSNYEASIDMFFRLTSIGGNTFRPIYPKPWFLNDSKMTQISPNVCLAGTPTSTQANCTGL